MTENQSTLTDETIVKLFFIRQIEEEIGRLYPTGLFRCPVHLAIGQEAAAVGVAACLKPLDKVFASHRSHHHFLAKGGKALSLLAELAGLPQGCSKGRGGSTHLIDESIGFFGSTAIIGGILPVASGAAHAVKMQQSGEIVVAFIGDGALEEGVFFETLNMATLFHLPLLIVIEDNDLSCYTAKNQRQAFCDYKKIAELFGISFEKADGAHLEEVIDKAQTLITQVRECSRPALLHVEVFRALEHCGPEADDHLAYRQVGEQWPGRDPLQQLKTRQRARVEGLEKKARELKEKTFKELGEYLDSKNI